MVKQKLTLSLDKEIITQAKTQNINLSSFLKIRLIDHSSDKNKCSRRDSNPSGRLSSGWKMFIIFKVQPAKGRNDWPDYTTGAF